jgi:hypothetical protein
MSSVIWLCVSTEVIFGVVELTATSISPLDSSMITAGSGSASVADRCQVGRPRRLVVPHGHEVHRVYQS